MKKGLWLGAAIMVCAVLIGIGILRKGGDGSTRTIAVIPKGTTHTFWQSVKAGAEQAAVEYPGLQIYWNGPDREGDREKQIQIVEDFIIRRIDAVVIAPVDDKALVPVVERLYRRQIPCVIIDSGIDTDNYVSFIATDNYQGGVVAARQMAKLLDGKGDVLVIMYAPGSASTTQRERGFLDTIAQEFPDIRIAGSQYGMDTVETALQVAEDLLTKNPQFNGIYACNESTTTGTLRALQQRGLAGKIKFVGFDASPLLLTGLGDGQIDALVVQDPFKMGYEGVKAAMAAMEGQPVPKMLDTGVQLVTLQNLSQPRIQSLLGIQ